MEGDEPDLYWAVMETMTALVRERTRPEAERLATPRGQRIEEGAYLLWKNAGSPEGRSDYFWSKAVEQEAQKERPATDIAAVLEVIRRRLKAGIAREAQHEWYFVYYLELNLTVVVGFQSGAGGRGAVLTLSGDRARLREANLNAGARLRGANLTGADLTGAIFTGADLTGANLSRARLRGSNLSRTRLNGANLTGAILQRADLDDVRLHDADLTGADLTDANLGSTNLSGADLSHTKGLPGRSLIKPVAPTLSSMQD